MKSSLLQKFLRKNMLHWWMHTISHKHRIVHGFWNGWKKNVPGLNDSKLHGVNYVSIREKTGKDTEELLNPRTMYGIMERISKPIRIKLKNMKNEFDRSFMKESPLPCELFTLLNLLMNGSNNEEPEFFLPVNPLAQIILYNHRMQGVIWGTASTTQWRKRISISS